MCEISSSAEVPCKLGANAIRLFFIQADSLSHTDAARSEEWFFAPPTRLDL